MEIGGFLIKFFFKICNKLFKGFNFLNCVVVCVFNLLSNVLMWGILDIECLSCIKFFVFMFL